MWCTILNLNSKRLTNTHAHINVHTCVEFWLQHDLLLEIAYLSGVVLSCTSYHAFFMSQGFNGCLHVCVCVWHAFVSVLFLVMSSSISVLKNLCTQSAKCSACALYINMCHAKVLRNVFPLGTLLLLSPPFPLSSRGTPSIQQVCYSLERHEGTACRIRFLPCSHSTLVLQGPRWNEIHMFKRFSCKYAHFTAGCHEALHLSDL